VSEAFMENLSLAPNGVAGETLFYTRPNVDPDAVLGIIKGHKGGVVVESAEGEGTTFRLILPATEPPVPVEEHPNNGRHSDDGSAATVLVIDDEEIVAGMARDILVAGKFNAIVSLSPSHAVELFRASHREIALVLLDLTMPEMSGREVVAALQAIDPGVKIIITSGYSEEEVTMRIGAVQVSAFIQKPYRMRSLLDQVHAVLD